ncbi:MAG: TlpA family protein disulfide reductase [Psychroflexus halocasei]
MRILLSLVFISFIASCTKTENEMTYIGGEVIHPLDSVVSISKDGELIKHIKIDSNNRFSDSIDIEEEGIYTFHHVPEWQLIYLKPNDSLVFRVNMKAFDESLAFGGSSAAENNFLINMYLMNEKNDNLILKYYKVKPSDFSFKTDSIRQMRLSSLEDLNQRYDFSDYFNRIAKKSIVYEFYDMRERYAFLIQKYFKERKKDFSDDFFNYRDTIDFNDDELLNHFGYLRFLDNYLKNKSIEDCDENDVDCFKINSFKNVKKRLTIADDLFTNDAIRNRFYKRFVKEEILFSKNENQLEDTKSLIKNCNLSDDVKKDLLASTRIQKNFLENKYLGNQQLVTSELDTITVSDLINKKPLAISSWSFHSPAYKNYQVNKVKNLQNKYPEIKFIGLNFDTESAELWKQRLNKFGIDKSKEYKLLLKPNAENREVRFIINHINRMFLINKKGHITKSNIPFSSNKIESNLLELVNQ